MKVIIVRDRKAAGGGIHHYYDSISGHLRVPHEFVDVAKPLVYYSAASSAGSWPLPTPVRLLLDWTALLAKLLRFPQVVHLNTSLDIKLWRSLRRDAVNLLLAKAFRRKVIVFWRGWDNDACGTPEFPGGDKGWLSRVYRLADAHIVLCSDFRDDLRRWGIETPIYLETTVVADSLLDELATLERPEADGVFRILYLSRVEVEKGVFEMLEAFALLASRHPGRYHLTVAGDGPALLDLKQRSAELGLNEVDFPGYVVGTDKARLLSKASAFCFLSYTEGMPNAVLEAMAAGLPLVTSAAGGLKDVLEEGVTGFIVGVDRSKPSGSKFDPEVIAARIERLADGADLCNRVGDYNRSYALQRFAATEVAERLARIYIEVMPTYGISIDNVEKCH